MPRVSWLERLRYAVKALRGMVWEGSRGGWGLWAPGSRLDEEEQAGDLWANSAVMACLGWIQRTFPEARLQVLAEEGGKRQEVPRHALPRLLRRPNSYYSGTALWQASVLSWFVDGNCYWIAAHDAIGRPVQLWYTPHWMMEPRWASDGSQYVTHYEYEVNGRREALPLEGTPEARSSPLAVVHLRYGIDPRNTRKGLAPLKAGLREINADNLATTYTVAMLRNTGAIPVIVSPAGPDTQITEPEREKLLELWRKRLTGNQAGQPLIAGGGVRVDRLALSPEEMVLDRIRQLPEARICALLGVKAMVADLSVGAEQRSYANLKEAQEQSIETCIIPAQKALAEQLEMQVLPLLGNPEREEVGWDYSEVRALQADEDAVYKRAATGYQAGIIRRSEAREMVGQPWDEGDELYFVEPRGPGVGEEFGEGLGDEGS